MKIKRVMSQNVVSVQENDTLQSAVVKMHKYNVGFIVVLKDKELFGVLTDRDALLSLVSGHTLSDPVHMICIKNVITTKSSNRLEDASELMGYYQIKRLVVLDDDNKVCGVISLRDLALKNEAEDLALDALQEISFGPNTSQYIIEYDNKLHDN